MGGHSAPYKIPDHTTFSTKGIPQLEELEKALEAKGLKDPWIRNEAWRYNPGFGTRWQRARNLFFRGLPLGAALTVVAVFAEKALGGGGGHGHGHVKADSAAGDHPKPGAQAAHAAPAAQPKPAGEDKH